jgi:prevent-host-death family protein
MMKFITVRDLRLKPGAVWKMAEKEKDIIITSNGRPVAILTGTNEDNLEAELAALRKARAITALDMIHKESVSTKTDGISSRIIDEEISKVRRGRKS